VALVPLNQNHRGNNHESCNDEAKRFQIVPQPPKDKHVADCHGDGRQDDNEKRTVHRYWFGSVGFSLRAVEFQKNRAG
jgi:hypothetical protein